MSAASGSTRASAAGSPPAANYELVFALVGPVATNLRAVERELRNELTTLGYEVLSLGLSDFLRIVNIYDDGKRVEVIEKPREDNLHSYMDAGSALRKMTSNAALAYLAAHLIKDIRAYRPGPLGDLTDASVEELHRLTQEHRERRNQAPLFSQFAPIDPPEPTPIPRRAYILRSLKHPDEVYVLRQIYRSGFFLIGVQTNRNRRLDKLAQQIAEGHNRSKHSDGYKEKDIPAAEALLKKDESEPTSYGQRVRDTFHLSDLFLSLGNESDEAQLVAKNQLTRFVQLIMGKLDHTPTKDEYLMFLAHAAALRSSALARQVGAILATPDGEVIAAACNDSPRAGGGQYWPNEHYDHRDIMAARDISNEQEERIVGEILAELDGGGHLKTELAIDAAIKLFRRTRFASVVEFSRTLHAEMEAILSAARNGSSVAGRDLYTTTYPCHECAKLIVGAGIRKVVYIEPYPKSVAAELFETEISDGTSSAETCPCGDEHHIPFIPFIGVGPRRFMEFFSTAAFDGPRRERKDAAGQRAAWIPTTPRMPLLPWSYLDAETKVAEVMNALLLDARHREEDSHAGV